MRTNRKLYSVSEFDSRRVHLAAGRLPPDSDKSYCHVAIDFHFSAAGRHFGDVNGKHDNNGTRN